MITSLVYYIGLLCSLLGMCLWLGRRLRWPSDAMPFFVVPSLIVLLYLAALAQMLPGATYLLFAAGLAMLAAWIVEHRRELPAALATDFTPGLACFLPIALLAWLCYRDSVYQYWDDISHWGFAFREVVVQNALWTADGPLLFKSYPPAAALFQYFVARFIGYSEGTAQVALNLLLASGMVCLLRGLRWRQWPAAPALLLIGYVAIGAFHQPLNTIKVDYALGACFGMGLVNYLAERDNLRAALLRTLPVAFVLPLLKDAGYYLAVVMCATILVDLLFHLKRPAARPPLRVIAPWVILVLLAVTAPFIAHDSWDRHLRQQGIHKIIDLPAATNKVTHGLSLTPAPSSMREMVQSMLNVMATRNLYRLPFTPVTPVTTCGLLLVITALALLGILLQRAAADRLRYGAFHGMLLLGFLGYVIGLLLLYLYTFTAYERSILSSYERYIGAYLVPWLLVSAFVVLHEMARSGRQNQAFLCVLVAIILFMRDPSADIATLLGPTGTLSKERLQAKLMTAEINRLTDPAAHVYLIFEDTNGYDFYLMKYELSPRLIGPARDARPSEPPWSLGPPHGKNPVWMVDYTPAQWADLLKAGHYAYVYLGNIDAVFLNRYGSLFDNIRDTARYRLYAVRIEHGAVCLHAVKQGSGLSP